MSNRRFYLLLSLGIVFLILLVIIVILHQKNSPTSLDETKISQEGGESEETIMDQEIDTIEIINPTGSIC